MTDEKEIRPFPARAGRLTPGQIVFGGFGVFCLFLILRNSETAIEYMTRGLHLCARTVIPSLFPFMVLSELIVSGGIGSALFSKIAAPFRKLFRLSDAGCTAVLLGILCGFPVGAKCASLAYTQGKLSKQDAERVLTFSCNPSSAFLISAVGTSLWGNREFGIALYATVLAASLLTGIFGARFQKQDDNAPVPASGGNASAPLSGPRLFTESVRSAAGSMILVCAYVIFFSALVGTLGRMLTALDLPAKCNAAIFCLFELSGGMSAAASLADVRFAALLSAFAAGWSGFSVHCQILSVCDGNGFSFRPYFLAKLFQALLSAFLFAILLALFPQLTVSEKLI